MHKQRATGISFAPWVTHPQRMHVLVREPACQAGPHQEGKRVDVCLPCQPAVPQQLGCGMAAATPNEAVGSAACEACVYQRTASRSRIACTPALHSSNQALPRPATSTTHGLCMYQLQCICLLPPHSAPAGCLHVCLLLPQQVCQPKVGQLWQEGQGGRSADVGTATNQCTARPSCSYGGTCCCASARTHTLMW